jgi:hypothetical protein
MGKLRIKGDGVSVEYSDTLERIARAALEKAAPGVVDALEARVEKLRVAAYKRWPVKTGRSREALELRTTLDPTTGRVTVGIVNWVRYAIYVRPTSLYGATTAWEAFVRKPVREAAKEVTKELGEAIVEAIREAKHG